MKLNNQLTQKWLRIAIFLSVVVGILYITNLVVYEAFTQIIGVYSSMGKIALGVIMGGLTAGFIFASILGMRVYNLVTRSLYYVTAIWMGFLVYLFLAAVTYGILVVFSVPGALVVGKVLMTLALMLGLYGVLHARHITVKKITVALPHLPQVWHGKVAIWISDLHLGQMYGSADAALLVKKVNVLPHDIIFIGGDMYDGTGAPDIVELAAPLRHFYAPMGTFFVTGNHEEIGDSQAFVKAVEAAGIRTLHNELVIIDGLQLIGVDYRSTKDRADFETTLHGLSIDSTKPSILLKHEPAFVEVAKNANISLQISGHTHQAQLWPLDYIAHKVYQGFSYGLKQWDNFQIYTSSGVGTWGPPMRVGTDREIVHITFLSQ